MRRGESFLKHLADGEAGGEARVLRHIGGAGALADGEFSGVGLDLAG